ncbi:unnamed protein product, partial [Oppiella nova]
EKPTIKILLLGLDNAGKTTTALHLIGDSLEDIIPTIGFSNLEMRRYEKYRVVVYDLGGGARIRAIWKNYFALIHGIIFVIDSSDISRVLEVKDVIEEVVSNDKISGKPILVLINKQDIEGALEELDICQYLKLESLINKFKCPTKVETCSANTRPENGSKIDPSIDNGYKWLLSFVAKNWLQLNGRVETDSNEQYTNEKKSLEERMNRFRSKKFETQESKDITNEMEFIKNGNPFKAIEDVIREVDQKKADLNASQLNDNFDHKSLMNGNKDFGSKLDLISSEGDDTSGEHSNDSNDLANNSLSDERTHDTDDTSGTQPYPIDKVLNKSSVQTLRRQKSVDEVISKSEAKLTKDLESRKSMSLESSQKSITSNRYNNHKKAKRKTKAMRNSKVSPDLSKDS